jgi:quercetin dioxygenase-like cupin family protein
MKKDQAWVTEQDVEETYRPGRKYIMFENKILGEKGTARLIAIINRTRKIFYRMRTALRQRQLNVRHLAEIIATGGANGTTLPNQGYPLPLPLPADQEKKWKPYFLFRGPTRGVKDISCHVSVLVNGHCPHPPHTHNEEEILMMLKGEADLHLPLYRGADGDARTRLKPGEFVFYPAGYPHTLRAASEEPANYMMFRWYTPNPKQDSKILPFGKFKIYDSLARDEGKEGFVTRTLFEGPSQWLTRLHAHTSILSPGAGYAPHVDPYDVAIIVLEGEVETLGKRFAPHSVIFHPAGQRHGMSNPGQTPAKYVVFEFER